MKKGLINIFATTGISLVLLSVIAVLYRAEFLCVETVFQVFLINAAAHLLFVFMNRIECKHLMMEAVMELILTIALSLLFGAVFNWYESVSPIILVLLSIAIYIIAIAFNLLHMKQEADEINQLIQIIKKE